MNSERDAQLDRLVDTRNISYDEAHRILGPEPAVDEATLAREAFRTYAQEEFRLTGADTRTEDERLAQIATNAAGRQAVEAALKAAKDQHRGE